MSDGAQDISGRGLLYAKQFLLSEPGLCVTVLEYKRTEYKLSLDPNQCWCCAESVKLSSCSLCINVHIERLIVSAVGRLLHIFLTSVIYYIAQLLLAQKHN